VYGVRLAWEDLPGTVRTWVEDVLGSPVVRAVSQPGGFSPGSADRVLTRTGQRAFVKAVSGSPNPGTPALHRREIEVLRDLVDVPEVPALLASEDDGEWVVLVVEDVEGRHPRLPWERPEVDATLGTLESLAARTAPLGWPSLSEVLAEDLGAWHRLTEEPDLRLGLDPWLADRRVELTEMWDRTLPRMAGDRICHLDVRADNLLVEADGRVRLVDWPWAARGAPWTDTACLLVNVRWGGELDVRPVVAAARDLGAEPEDLLGLLAGLAGLFAESASRPPAPGLPTLREFQRQQAVAATRLLRELWPDGRTG
jgi:hypothetical protein